MTYTRMIAGMERSFTGYTSKAAARRTIHQAHNPCLVEINEGGKIIYDAYPLGHPLPKDARIIERCTAGKWRSA